ncbi:MAG: hypothetical protein JEZ00_07750 [Anaerolineaceae bacterium]|nr:hypothetical protein [Anaerolineaceae bacterium]
MENKEHLQEQIDLLRTLIHLVRDQITEEIEIRQLITVLDAIGKAATRLATLIKAQQILGEDENFAAVLAEAVREVGTDFKSRG